MAFCFKVISISTFVVLTFFLRKGTCGSICPNGVTKNITGTTSGKLVYPSSGTYGKKEEKCWRIEVPKPYTGLGIHFQSYEIEECKNCECDSLAIYRGSAYRYPRIRICGRSTPRHQEYVEILRGNIPQLEINGENTWIRFVSDDTVNYKGFSISYIAKSVSPGHQRSFLNASEDETISFGTLKDGSKNYPADFEWQWFLAVPEGRQLQITFDSFEMEQSKNCENAYLEIRETTRSSFDSNDQYGAILSDPLCGNNKPNTIQSAGNIVWVHFKSNINAQTTHKGFKASFMSGQGRLFTIHPITLLFISALLITASKESLF